MSFYDDIYRIPVQAGEKKLTLDIESSLRAPSCHFEFYENDSVWTVYWNRSLPNSDLVSTMREVYSPEMDWDDFLRSPTLNNAIQRRNPFYSHVVDEKVVGLLQVLCKQGLPKPKTKTGGQDGHSYTVIIEELSTEDSCWDVIPEEWSILKPIIDKCVAYANLDDSDYGYYKNRRTL